MCIVQDVVIWEPPQLGWFKLNTNVAVDVQNGKVSYGAGIRNHEGLVMLAETNFGNYCEDVAIAEAEAICFGIQLAKETGLFPLMIESDSLFVIQLIQGKQHTRTKLLWIISDVQQFMQPKHDFRIRHISRNGNQAADALAKYALQTCSSFVLLEDFPQSIDCYL